MTTFVEMHALRSFPPSNLNRDDLGSPKTAIFGGARRLRISSQCLKRTWRVSEHLRGVFAEDQLGIRTVRLPEQVLKALGTDFDEASRLGLIALLSSLGKKSKKDRVEDEPDEEKGEASDEGSEESAGGEAKTAHLLFLSRQEIEAVASFAIEKKEALGKVFNKKKADSKGIETLRKALKEYLDKATSKNAVDVGLFGRFVTSPEFDTIDGALQVAHALGTQKAEIEYDYFTAVDDLGETSGAGHLGETEFSSSVLYLYACCDLGQLERNLGQRSADGRVADPEARELAQKCLPALVKAMAQATPTGKKTGTAPHTPAEYVEVVVRRGSPLSFANAFIKPVGAREGEGDVMTGSIERLVRHRGLVENAYGRDSDLVARFVLCLKDVANASDDKSHVGNLSQLSEKLAKILATLGEKETA